MKKVSITLVKSIIGRNPKHVVIAKTLGLSKINQSVVHQDIPSIRGMLNKVEYLLNIEECK